MSTAVVTRTWPQKDISYSARISAAAQDSEARFRAQTFAISVTGTCAIFSPASIRS